MPKARAPAPQCGCVKTAPSLFRRRRPAPKDHTACQRDCVKTASPQHGWIGGRLRREEKTAHAYGPHRAETKDGCAEKRCCVKTARAPKAHTVPYRRRRPRLRLRTPPCRRPRALSVERKVGCGGKEKTAARQHANMAGSEDGCGEDGPPRGGKKRRLRGRTPTWLDRRTAAQRGKDGCAPAQRNANESEGGGAPTAYPTVERKDGGGAAARQRGWIGGWPHGKVARRSSTLWR